MTEIKGMNPLGSNIPASTASKANPKAGNGSGSIFPDLGSPTLQSFVAQDGKSVTVEKGDGLWKIAKETLVSEGNMKPTNAQINQRMKEISDLNDLNYNPETGRYKTIHPGDVLKLTGKPEPAPEPPKPEPAPEPPKPAPKKGLTPEQRAEARHVGSNVADHLVGYTDDNDKSHIRNYIKTGVTKDNVMDFFEGYEKNKG